MTDLIMTKGLPGSGKTTWAMTKTGDGYLRINKDDLRAMMFEDWKPKREKSVLKARDALVSLHLSQGRHVIVDDTNLHPKHETRLRQLATKHGAEFKVQDYTDVDLRTCLERNRLRQDKDPVPEGAIRKMWVDYIRGPIEYDETLPRAVIVDVDGTLAHMVDRGPFDWDKVGSDALDPRVFDAVNAFYGLGYQVILLSGRDGSCRLETEEWLNGHSVPRHELRMRVADDMRPDYVVKRELFENHIRGRFYPWLVIDDRDQVVRMWRDELGLTVWQVADGDF